MQNRTTEILEENDLVYYCKSCHSLCIVSDETLSNEDWDGSYCGKCMSTDVGICSMDEWIDEEEKRKKRQKEIEWSR